MLMDREQSVLMVIDMQGKLLTLTHDWQRVLDRCIWLVRVAQRLGVPAIATEQYPKGLGGTVDDLRALLEDRVVAHKEHFSCVASGCLETLPDADRRQAVLCGIESHVCVLQTALELRWQGREVFVVADAVTSRNPDDRELSLARLRSHGVEIVSAEMVAFEWMKKAGTDEFRAISREFLR